MAIALVYSNGSALNANPTSGNFSLGSEGSDWNAGDVALFGWYSKTATKTFTDNSGGKLTILYEDATGGAGRTTFCRRVLVTGDVATDFAWTTPSIANTTVHLGTLVFSGVDTTTPIDADSGTPGSQINTGTAPNGPLVTVATAGAAVVTFNGANDDYSSLTAPTNYTAAGNSTDSTNQSSAAFAYRLGLGTGNEDPDAWTWTGVVLGTDGTVWTVALKPAAASGVVIPVLMHAYRRRRRFR